MGGLALVSVKLAFLLVFGLLAGRQWLHCDQARCRIMPKQGYVIGRGNS